MRAISIWQPWAWLIVRGFKPVENRSWYTSHRGPLLIHASKKYDTGFDTAWAEDIINAPMPPASFFDNLRGGVVGMADLIGVVDQVNAPHLTARDKPWFFGPRGWLLDNAKPLPFYPYNGKQGLFDIDYPFLNSGPVQGNAMPYTRQKNDAYYSEPWVIDALMEEWHLPDVAWEPFAGRGALVRRLRRRGRKVYASDIQLCKGFRLSARMDFLQVPFVPGGARAIVTNPPYKKPLCEKMIRHALGFLERGEIDTVAMLLPLGWSANSGGRRDLFGKYFACKMELTRRIRFFENTEEHPRQQHAWYIWHRNHTGQAYFKLQRQA